MALTKIDDRGLKTPIDLLDNEKIRLGTGNDLELYHDGSHSSVANSTGNLNLTSAGAVVTKVNTSEDAIVCNANGAVDLYYDNSKKLETTNSGVTVTGDVGVNSGSLHITTDGQRLRLGAGSGGSGDLEIYHDGTASFIENGTGNLAIRGKTGENHIVMIPDSKTALYYDDSKKFETTSYGTLTTGESRADNFQVLDYDGSSTGLMKFGAGDDLKIYHDGTHSYIKDAGTGGINLDTNNLYIRSASGSETLATFNEDGAVELYYDGNIRSSTATNGCSVRGKSFLAREDGGIGDYTSVRVGFWKSIAASSSYTFQVGSQYAIGTVTIFGSRHANATVATGKIYNIHIRAGATAGLGSQIASDIGGASGGHSYSVAAASQGITVHNTDNTFAMNTFVTFDLTGFIG